MWSSGPLIRGCERLWFSTSLEARTADDASPSGFEQQVLQAATARFPARAAPRCPLLVIKGRGVVSAQRCMKNTRLSDKVVAAG